mmetsp:Transcript_55794/g.110757  ORF Transcript_55794/g.110757 Transcript_55794/m.110757 type:complete len:88 (+) Transcript_55794:83-346(+)
MRRECCDGIGRSVGFSRDGRDSFSHVFHFLYVAADCNTETLWPGLCKRCTSLGRRAKGDLHAPPWLSLQKKYGGGTFLTVRIVRICD